MRPLAHQTTSGSSISTRWTTAILESIPEGVVDSLRRDDCLECDGQDAEQKSDPYNRKEIAGSGDHRDGVENLLEERRVAD